MGNYRGNWPWSGAVGVFNDGTTAYAPPPGGWDPGFGSDWTDIAEIGGYSDDVSFDSTVSDTGLLDSFAGDLGSTIVDLASAFGDGLSSLGYGLSNLTDDLSSVFDSFGASVGDGASIGPQQIDTNAEMDYVVGLLNGSAQFYNSRTGISIVSNGDIVFTPTANGGSNMSLPDGGVANIPNVGFYKIDPGASIDFQNGRVVGIDIPGMGK